MKNTVKVRNHVAKIAAPSQPQTLPPKSCALELVEYEPEHHADGLHEIRKVFGRIELTNKDIDALGIAADALKRGGFSAALKIGRDAMLKAVPDDLEKESAMMQSNALTRLLFEVINLENIEGSGFSKCKDSGTLLRGVQNLVWTTQARLTHAIIGPVEPMN